MDNKEIINLILSEVKLVSSQAEKSTKCLRKAVGCSLMSAYKGSFTTLHVAFNGPSRKEYKCSNIVGACGCSHAEPRAIMECLKHYSSGLIMACSFSPCVNCANIIIDSGLIIGLVYNQYAPHHPEGLKMLVESSIPVVSMDILASDRQEVLEQVNKWMETPLC